MKKKQGKVRPSASQNIPRQVRMPPELDEWLRDEAARSAVGASVADKIREIVAAAYQAKRNSQEQAA